MPVSRQPIRIWGAVVRPGQNEAQCRSILHSGCSRAQFALQQGIFGDMWALSAKNSVKFDEHTEITCKRLKHDCESQVFLLTKCSRNRQKRYRFCLGASSDRAFVSMMDGPFPSHSRDTITREDLSAEWLYPILFRRNVGLVVGSERDRL